MAGKAGKTRRRKKTQQKQPDLEAIGLVLLAVGIFILGVLVPQLPTGDFGAGLRNALRDRIGWGAYTLPWPPLVLGGFFLLRKNPPGWPRVLLGYLTLMTGLWLLFALGPSPEVVETGGWGALVEERLAGAAGWLALIPALLVTTLGIELIFRLAPFTIVRVGLIRLVTWLGNAFRAAARARRVAKDRAAFGADVALERNRLVQLDRDLEALSALYPGSTELAQWRKLVNESRDRLQKATPEALEDVRFDGEAWEEAITAFARDRAREYEATLKAEGIVGFEEWLRGIKAQLDDAVAGAGPVAKALDSVRNGMALDLTALGERNRRLTRERDLAVQELASVRPRELKGVGKAHAERERAFLKIDEDAQLLGDEANLLEGWRDVAVAVENLRAELPDASELKDYEATLTKELRGKGRKILHQLEGWKQALVAVEDRGRREQLRVEQERREAQERAQEEALGEGQHNANDVAIPAAARELLEAAEAAEQQVDSEAAGQDGPPAQPEPVEAASDGAAQEPAAQPTAEPAAEPTAGPAQIPEQFDTDAPWEDVPWEISEAQREELARAHLTTGKSQAAQESRPRAAAPVLVGPDGEELPEVGGIPIQVPSFDLLDEPNDDSREDPTELAKEVRERVGKIDETLANFKLQGRVVSSVRGPTVTRFEVEPAPGEKISRFANLSDDLALAMAVGSVRIEAPIPGKSVIGLEVPNAHRDLIRFRRAAESPSFKRSRARLPLILGQSIDGEMVVGDLGKMPHLLIAGSTGSGKSVAVNTLIGSLLFKFLPTELRFLMIDPKMVELTPFDGIPHLLRPVVTNPNDAAHVLLGAVAHMERRYKMMSRIGAKNLDQYNEKARNLDLPQLPFIVIIIDELADLMITSPKEVESAIMRLAQMARATGMHLVLATQRPSVDILTSLIKVNVPARIAFAVSSGHDSRTILDTMGAERLVGMGDMLFYQPGLSKPMRLQGPFISEAETGALSAFLRRQYFEDEFVEAYGDDFDPPSLHESEAEGMIDWNDDKLRAAAELVIQEGQASVSRLQRRLQVGHARAGKLMDSLEALGVVGAHSGSKPREVLVDFDELPNIFGK